MKINEDRLLLFLILSIIFFYFLFFTTGCASKPPERIVTQYVQTPVRYCPAPPEIKRPWLEVQGLQPEDEDGVVALKYHSSLVALKFYAEELEDIVQSYRDIANKNPIPTNIKARKLK